MSYVDVQHSPWPADGLPLAKAFWVVIDQRIQARVKKVSDQIWRVEDHASINNFCDTMEKGHYRGKGRRVSPTAELTDIPATAWPYFLFLYMYESLLYERGSNIVWYDVRIWPAGVETPAPETPTPGHGLADGPKRRKGRPSSKELVRTEAKRRLDANENIPETQKEFVNQLAKWLNTEHPKAPAMKPHTVENNIRDLWSKRSETRN
jgi:hypothetical protein